MNHLLDLFWKMVAAILVRLPERWLFSALCDLQEPYQHIYSADGKSQYMGRWWLLNPYEPVTYRPRFNWLPWNIRLHHIMRPDADKHKHSHPWNARTIILKGWYIEERQVGTFRRRAGYTGRLMYGEYHRIAEVSPGGVWTIFITGRKKGIWNFLVNGTEVPSAEYLSQERK